MDKVPGKRIAPNRMEWVNFHPLIVPHAKMAAHKKMKNPVRILANHVL